MKVEPLDYPDRRVFSVGAVNRGLADWLRRLPDLWVEGEVTELRHNPGWKSAFFTLKDTETGACLQTSIDRRRLEQLQPLPETGETVHVHGRARLYEAKGELSFRASRIERIGLGAHMARLEQLKLRLAAEGLFGEERKRPLPLLPKAVGLLTGTDAAARGDVLTAIRTRFAPAHVVLLETRVQGPGAPAAIVEGLRRLGAHASVEVVVLTRGGGSFEDLLPFSDERVVRAVAACPVPVVSAVGHEQDTPLCDLAADARAATPTAAARLVVPDLEGLLASLERSAETMQRGARRLLDRDRTRLDRAADALRATPARLLERRRAALEATAGRLHALAPAATLARGYAIVRSGGAVVRDASLVRVEDTVDVELARGGLRARVEEVTG